MRKHHGQATFLFAALLAAPAAVASQYPRAFEWLKLVQSSMQALPAAASDSTKITDSVNSLAVAEAESDGPGNDKALSPQCRVTASAVSQGPPRSGQITPYGAGSDGDVRAGSGLSYTDNGDGTITDNVTALMWEKKDDSGGIHDKDNAYSWSGASSGGTNFMDGTIATTFLATLNAGPGFAGHTDWRIPNAKELQSIVNYEVLSPQPAVDPVFHHAASCSGCTDVTAVSCSCTASDGYWSSSTYRDRPSYAWNVNFGNGGVYSLNKYSGYKVRAVRGGLRSASQ